MITRDTEENFWEKVLFGAETIGKSEGVALEYFGSRSADAKEFERYLEIAVLSRVDGILCSIPSGTSFQHLINEAYEKKIPFVALGKDTLSSNNLSFVGINSYNLGFKSGVALANTVKKETKVAVFINSSLADQSYDRYLYGFKRAIQDAQTIKVELIINSKGESISAEEQTQLLLKNYPEIEAIVCTDANDTLGVAKVVVDLNRVSKTTIIGSGLTSEIANYIELGVIEGVLAMDPFELGVQGMSALLRLKQNKSQKEKYYIPLFFVNKDNVKQFTNNYITVQ
jgi:ribose transport system substrate-binding protein